ncbi:MAG: PBP1A family penicillin-binding protein [Rhizobiales bacterium]|nr:PBP1A family penicillin-binding protein [Hyphomicrobiales bacterium]
MLPQAAAFCRPQNNSICVSDMLDRNDPSFDDRPYWPSERRAPDRAPLGSADRGARHGLAGGLALLGRFWASESTTSNVSGQTPARRTGGPRRSRPGLRRLVIWTAGLTFTPVVAALAVCAAVLVTMPKPSLERAVVERQVVKVLARDGSLLAQRGDEHRIVPLAAMPRQLIQAVIATEDSRFLEHSGVDLVGLARATFANVRAGRYVQGGSTITQQLAKNLFLAPDRNLLRKAQELMLAFWLEWRLDKPRILELYLNRVYFGGGAHGVAMAADRYFGKRPEELGLAECAVLAGLLKAPTRFAPTGDPRRTLRHARVVLKRMRAEGYITAEEEAATASRPVKFKTGPRRLRSRGADYAADWVLDELDALVGTTEGTIIVRTTIDSELQHRAQSIVRQAIDVGAVARGAEQASVVVLDHNGGVRVMVGGVSHDESQYNRAVRATRQPGSAFKPLVYLAAMEAGFTPDSVAYDEPVEVDGWSPRNATERYRGRTTLREALSHSYNTVAVRLMMEVGAGKVAKTAARLGVRTPVHTNPSLALGTAEVTPLELTAAYAHLANGGSTVTPHAILDVRRADGTVLYERKSAAETRVVEETSVAAMSDMLAHTLSSGTGKRAAIPPHPAAGKTGTSQEFRDAWFIGYTGHLTAGVWVGNDANRSMQSVSGGDIPAHIWREVMLAAHEGLLPKPLAGSYAAKLMALRERPRSPDDPSGSVASIAELLDLAEKPAVAPMGLGLATGDTPPAAKGNQRAESDPLGWLTSRN